jgi:hypothetical protein
MKSRSQGLVSHKRVGLLVAFLIVSFSSLSCNSEQAAVPKAPEPTRAPVAQATELPTPAPTSTPEPATATPEPTPGLPEIAGLDSLASYRFDVLWQLQQPGAQPVEMGHSVQRVRGEQPATHVVVFYPNPDQPGVTLSDESITIGDTWWMRQPDGSWLSGEGALDTSPGEDFWPVDALEVWISAGEEIVDGVHCQRYMLPDGFTFSVPADEGSVSVAVQGALCVANQPDLPAVLVRQELQWQGAYSPFPFIGTLSPTETMTTVLRIDLTSINQPINIEAPEQGVAANQAVETQIAAQQTSTAQPAATPAPPPSQTQPHNDPLWDGAWANIAPENHIGQTFVPTTQELFSVQVGIVVANAGRGGDTITLRVLSADDEVLAAVSQSVPEGFEGWLEFQLPGGVLPVAPGQLLKMELADTGKVAFGWQYSGDTYPDGTAIVFGSPEPDRDFFFRVNY